MTEPLLRRMCAADLPVVMEIDRQSLPRPWSEATWREELDSTLGLYMVLAEGGAISGYIGVKLVADEIHVMTLAVRPNRRRQGFARVLLKAVLAHPTSVGARRVYLEVRTNNLEARALYSSLGFVQTGVRPGYYGDEDALLLTLNLGSTR
ncbi:MAG TPA: ribosomal protein S18-alanine N-acetyltransferase [Rubrobacteraceae bacterium]|nr:ribosomal protein S18-alanine N-acetyltransferase [Rubrobacteraceae bacterium]